jgi:hypothetical protein
MKGNKNIAGLYMNANSKSNFNAAKPALVRPHPGHGYPVINLMGQLGICKRYVIVIYRINIISGMYIFLIRLTNILIYSFIGINKGILANSFVLYYILLIEF